MMRQHRTAEHGTAATDCLTIYPTHDVRTPALTDEYGDIEDGKLPVNPANFVITWCCNVFRDTATHRSRAGPRSGGAKSGTHGELSGAHGEIGADIRPSEECA
jgi:hypothetical protein